MVTSSGFEDRFIAIQGAVTQADGKRGEHAHVGTAFTTWINLVQAEVIRDALNPAGIAPAADLDPNFEALRADLSTLDRSLEDPTSGLNETLLIASHPVYQYLARRYDLNVKSVHWEPDAFPSEDMWAELEALRLEHPARWMIWEEAPLPQAVGQLEAMGIRSVVFDPAGHRPDEGDFLTVMKANVEAIRTIGDQVHRQQTDLYNQ